MSADLQYYRTAILAASGWPESNRRFQSGLAAIFAHQQCPFSYCHAFTGDGLGYTGSEEAVSRRVTRDLWEAKRASASVGRKTFEYIPGGGNLKRPTQYVTNYLNVAAEFLRTKVEADAEAIPFAAKVSKHQPEARKLLPRLQQKSIKRRIRKAEKRAGRNTGGAASTLKDDLNDLSALGLAAENLARDGFFVLPLYTALEGVCDCKKGAECVTPGKHPRIKRRVQCATRNKWVIRGWWRRWPSAGIGILTGTYVSAGLFLVVIDVDRRKFGHGLLAGVVDELGEQIPETRRVITGDGWHFYFWVHTDAPPTSFAFAGKGVEIKGSTAVVAAPPTVHWSGHVYQWESDTAIATLSGALAEWVLARGRSEKVKISDRHDFLVRCGRALAAAQFSFEEILGTLRLRLEHCCETGGRDIDEAELKGIARWAFEKEAKESRQGVRVA